MKRQQLFILNIISPQRRTVADKLSPKPHTELKKKRQREVRVEALPIS